MCKMNCERSPSRYLFSLSFSALSAVISDWAAVYPALNAVPRTHSPAYSEQLFFKHQSSESESTLGAGGVVICQYLLESNSSFVCSSDFIFSCRSDIILFCNSSLWFLSKSILKECALL